MRKAVPSNKMALDITTALQGATYAIIQTKCYMFLSDKYVHVSFLLNHIRTQVNALSQLPA